MGRYRKDIPPENERRPDDDLALWETVTRSVKKLSPRPAVMQASKNVVTAAHSEQSFPPADPTPKQTAPAAPNKSPAQIKPADFRLGETFGIDRSSARRLQRGQMQIDGRLDLHGLSQEQAHKQLTTFIGRAAQQNFRYVLVITGKGRDGHGILRQQVPVWLKDAPLNRYINAMSYAQPQDGGTGALYIRLKRQRSDICGDR